MFGYIIPEQSKLTNNSNKKLNMYYCSLCHNTQKIYGNIPRLFLSYDVLLPLIILDSITENPIIIESKKCIVHPFFKNTICSNLNISYISELNILLFYYKLLDDINDNNNLKYKLLFKSIKKYKQKCPFKYLDTFFIKNLSDLLFLEKSSKKYSLDELSEPLGKLIGSIFENFPERISENSLKKRSLLYNLGYNLGKWVYLIDAVDDLNEDENNKSFNPLIHSTFDITSNKSQKIKRISIILLTLLDNSCNIIEKLNIKKNKELIDNYMYISLKNITMNILNK